MSDIAKAFGHLGPKLDPSAGPHPTTFVLYIEFADDPPRVAVFDTFDEAEAHLDAFEVSVFDPPRNDELDRALLRARIFKCNGVSIAFNYKGGDCSGWGTEVDIHAAREAASAAQNETELVLEWKQVGDRWIAYCIEGDAEQGRYEVFKDAQGWECARMFDGGNSVVETFIAATFEQAKQVAERHWETGAWANMTRSSERNKC